MDLLGFVRVILGRHLPVARRVAFRVFRGGAVFGGGRDLPGVAVSGLVWLGLGFGVLGAADPAVVFTAISRGDGDVSSRPGAGLYLCAEGGRPRLLTADFVEACDASVSFDGQRVLFAGRKRWSDPRAIWVQPLDGGAAELVVSVEGGDCSEPVYLPEAGVNPPMFDVKSPWICFAVTDVTGGASSLYVYSLNLIPDRGHVLWRVTYGPGEEFGPTVLQDGRVVFSSIGEEDTSLLSVTWEGDNLNLFFRDAARPGLKFDACAMPGRRLAFVEAASGADRADGGELAVVRLQRPLKSHRRLAADAAGRFRTPTGFADGRMLVAYCPPGGDFGLRWLEVETGRLGDRFWDDAGVDEIDPQPVVAREAPISRIPMVEFASVLDISGFSEAGQLHCMNVYDSTLGELQGLSAGTVKWARFLSVIEGDAAAPPPDVERVMSAAWPPADLSAGVIGEVPVEPDGSFFANLQGNIPFSIQLLDANRHAMVTMRSWVWIRSGGQRGCIGCHENKELSPDNRASDALIRKRPTFLTAPVDAWRRVGYREDIAPILAQNCAGCHGSEGGRGGLDFSDPVRGYVGLMETAGGRSAKVLPNAARSSRLVHAVWRGAPLGGATEGPVGAMPPRGALSEQEQELIAAWVDLGCRWSSSVSRGAGESSNF